MPNIEILDTFDDHNTRHVDAAGGKQERKVTTERFTKGEIRPVPAWQAEKLVAAGLAVATKKKPAA